MDIKAHNNIAHTIQQASFFRAAHAEQIDNAEGAADAWSDFMSYLESHKDYCEEIDQEGEA